MYTHEHPEAFYSRILSEKFNLNLTGPSRHMQGKSRVHLEGIHLANPSFVLDILTSDQYRPNTMSRPFHAPRHPRQYLTNIKSLQQVFKKLTGKPLKKTPSCKYSRSHPVQGQLNCVFTLKLNRKGLTSPKNFKGYNIR